MSVESCARACWVLRGSAPGARAWVISGALMGAPNQLARQKRKGMKTKKQARSMTARVALGLMPRRAGGAGAEEGDAGAAGSGAGVRLSFMAECAEHLRRTG